MKTIIFGGSGRLGAALKDFCVKKKVKVFTISKNKKSDFNCDLIKTKNLKIIKRINPNIIFNCVALTDVDLCNKDINKAYNVNVKTAANITYYLKKK